MNCTVSGRLPAARTLRPQLPIPRGKHHFAQLSCWPRQHPPPGAHPAAGRGSAAPGSGSAAAGELQRVRAASFPLQARLLRGEQSGQDMRCPSSTPKHAQRWVHGQGQANFLGNGELSGGKLSPAFLSAFSCSRLLSALFIQAAASIPLVPAAIAGAGSQRAALQHQPVARGLFRVSASHCCIQWTCYADN